jgi:hypothetical protein
MDSVTPVGCDQYAKASHGRKSLHTAELVLEVDNVGQKRVYAATVNGCIFAHSSSPVSRQKIKRLSIPDDFRIFAVKLRRR